MDDVLDGARVKGGYRHFATKPVGGGGVVIAICGALGCGRGGRIKSEGVIVDVGRVVCFEDVVYIKCGGVECRGRGGAGCCHGVVVELLNLAGAEKREACFDDESECCGWAFADGAEDEKLKHERQEPERVGMFLVCWPVVAVVNVWGNGSLDEGSKEVVEALEDDVFVGAAKVVPAVETKWGGGGGCSWSVSSQARAAGHVCCAELGVAKMFPSMAEVRLLRVGGACLRL